MNTEEIKVLLEAQQKQIQELSKQLEASPSKGINNSRSQDNSPEKRSPWQTTFAILTTILSSGAIGAVLGYETKQREIRSQELGIIQQFLPELAKEPPAPESALLAISSSRNSEDRRLVIELASLIPEKGGTSLLAKIIGSTSFGKFDKDQRELALKKLSEIGENKKNQVAIVSAIQNTKSSDAEVIKVSQEIAQKIAEQPENIVTTGNKKLQKWAIIFGSDDNFAEASDEINNAKTIFPNQSQSVALYKKGNWYVTAISGFTDKETAVSEQTNQLSQGRIRKDTYVVDLNLWCKESKKEMKDRISLYQCQGN
jgi:vacuolar-type H+-ATPase subunit F/Vma7